MAVAVVSQPSTVVNPSFEPTGTVASHSVFDSLGYAWGQCAAWLAENTSWLNGAKGLGNAADWLTNAKAQGYQTSTAPIVGSIAVFGANTPGSGGNGHVALVTGVTGSAFSVDEANVKGLDTVSTGSYSATDPNLLGFILPQNGVLPAATATTTAATSSGGIDLNPLDWVKTIGIFLVGLVILGFALFYLFKPAVSTAKASI